MLSESSGLQQRAFIRAESLRRNRTVECLFVAMKGRLGGPSCHVVEKLKRRLWREDERIVMEK